MKSQPASSSSSPPEYQQQEQVQVVQMHRSPKLVHVEALSDGLQAKSENGGIKNV